MWQLQILTYLERKSINSKGFKKIELINSTQLSYVATQVRVRNQREFPQKEFAKPNVSFL